MPEYQIGTMVYYAEEWRIVTEFVYNRTERIYLYQLSMYDFWVPESAITTSLEELVQ